jgi:ElaB/YqjD/DUF883 family membrane-anchored ribosome-binding protein
MLQEKNCMETRVSSLRNESRTRPTERLVDDFKVIVQRAEEKAAERARAADKVVRDHPYQTIGIALGVGVLVGFLARRGQARLGRTADSTGC